MAQPSPSPFPLFLITAIRVRGYKSLVDATLTVRPLTLLAGANSSGKSSMLQPLLLIKQTMEATYQPSGALLLNGPHVQITAAEQIISKVEGSANSFVFSADLRDEWGFVDTLTFNYEPAAAGFALTFQESAAARGSLGSRVHLSMTDEEIRREFPTHVAFAGDQPLIFQVERIGRHFLGVMTKLESGAGRGFSVGPGFDLEELIASTLHIPGLRTAPKRSYPFASMERRGARGTFDAYTAGIIQEWQRQGASELTTLLNALRQLELTSAIRAAVVNANELEVQVGRLPVSAPAQTDDFVNIADVGFGVSQVLPVVVALIAAEPNQLVYIEQPELHLHPRAQVQMAHLLADAAKRGVRVIVETHSSLILLTIQTLVAEAKLSPDEVALHWFARDENGATQVTLAEVDADGAYGPWPEDFGDVELTAQSTYLNAVAARQANPGQ